MNPEETAAAEQAEGRSMQNQFSSVAAAIEAIGRGEVVIVVDAEDRENEGDFILAAAKATAESVNFVISGRGDFCMPVLPDVCQRLELTPIVSTNTAPLATAFMTPLDHRTCKTGITAEERATTVRAVIDPATTTEDFVRPGHVHLLLAKEGGVLRRAGHTEAAVDLARMAGLTPAGVICEILDDSGQRANREQLFALARRHDLQIISIEQLIAHRLLSEQLICRAGETMIESPTGAWKAVEYEVRYEKRRPLALIFGDPAASSEPPLVRMHASDATTDLLDTVRDAAGGQLRVAVERIRAAGAGVLVYLPRVGPCRGDSAKSPSEVSTESSGTDAREYGVGIQVLSDLGLKRIRLLTNHPKPLTKINRRGFDFEVVEQVPITPIDN